MSRKTKGLFPHPHKKEVSYFSISATSQNYSVNPQDPQATESRLIFMKQIQIKQKQAQLRKLKEKNNELQSLETNYEKLFRGEKEKLLAELEKLNEQLDEVQAEIISCQELERINIDEYLNWRNTQAKKNHFERLENLRKEYSEQNSHKISQISKLTADIDEAKKECSSLETQLQKQQGVVVENEKQQEVVMPNVRQIGSQLAYLRDKVKILRENKKLMTIELKERLDTNSWPVKKHFQESKQKIAKQMKRLLSYLQKSDKEISTISATEKNPNPLSLIEGYESRLAQLQQIIPQELKTEEFLKCLKPLPWRSIKGSGIDPSSSPTSEIHSKFNKMQKDFVDSEARNLQLKNAIKQKDIEIDKLLQLLNEMQEKIKQYRK